MKKILPILSLSALLLISCSKSSSPTSTNNNNNNNGNNTSANQVVATVNGTPVTFKTLGTAGNGTTYINGVVAFAIAGRDSVTGQTITIGGGGFVSAGNTYDIGTKTTTYGFGLTYSTKDANGYTVNYGTNSSTYAKVGSITITSISSSNAQGSFSATLPQTNPSGSGTVAITNGSFNVNY